MSLHAPWQKKRTKKGHDTFNFENISIKNSKELIIGLTIDNKHSFINHVKKILISKAKDLCIFKDIKLFRLKTKGKFLKVMIRSHASYWPLFWMFFSRKSNKLISKVHEKSLRRVTGVWK